MSVTGINFTLETKDFFFDNNGQIDYLEGKERNIRNFVKMLITESGNIKQIRDTDERYNPKFGLDYSKMYAPTKEMEEAVKNVKESVKRSVDRFIENQKDMLDFYDENEIFVKGVVDAAPYYTIGVYFTIALYTAEDIRLNRSPTFDKSFTTTRTVFERTA